MDADGQHRHRHLVLVTKENAERLARVYAATRAPRNPLAQTAARRALLLPNPTRTSRGDLS